MANYNYQAPHKYDWIEISYVQNITNFTSKYYLKLFDINMLLSPRGKLIDFSPFFKIFMQPWILMNGYFSVFLEVMCVY